MVQEPLHALVQNGLYAKLSPSAKVLIQVLDALANKETGLIPAHHSKLDTLAAFAGISRNATRTALQLLHDTNLISLSTTQGHPARIVYLPIVQLSTQG